MLLQKFLVVPEKSLPIIAVPSTAGTGAEVTVGAVITNSRGGKFASVIVGLNVHTVLLDSELTVRAPWTITASCGIDALSHGLEGDIADVRSSQDDMGKSRHKDVLELEAQDKCKDIFQANVSSTWFEGKQVYQKQSK